MFYFCKSIRIYCRETYCRQCPHRLWGIPLDLMSHRVNNSMAIKFDMAKAYARVGWLFLRDIIQRPKSDLIGWFGDEMHSDSNFSFIIKGEPRWFSVLVVAFIKAILRSSIYPYCVLNVCPFYYQMQLQMVWLRSKSMLWGNQHLSLALCRWWHHLLQK